MKYLLSFLIFGLLLTTAVPCSLAQEPPKAPENMEEVETMGEETLKGFPGTLEKTWQEALGIWKKMAEWIKDFYFSYISTWFKNIWQKICSFLGKEVERKKPEIKEGFEEEKQELKEEIPRVGQSIWERFKDLIK